MRGPDPKGRLSFGLLLVSQLAATMGFTFVMPFMPLYVQELGVGDPGDAAAWAGVLNGAAAATMALAAPLWGRLADRLGLKAMLLRATLAGSVVLALMGLVESPWQLLALRLLQGMLTGTVAAATVLVSSTAPPDRAGERLGILQMVIFVSAAAGPFFGGTFADMVGIRASFFVTAALLAVSGVMVMLGVREVRPPRAESPSRESSSAETSSGDEVAEDTKVPLPRRRLLPALLALFAVQAAIMSVAPALPGFISALTESQDRIASQTGLIMASGALAAALGSLLGGRLAARFGRRRVIVCALLFAGLAALPQAAASTVAVLWSLHFAASLFLGIVVPVANLDVRAVVPARRQGAAFGIAASAVSIGNALGPLAGGMLASALGFWAAFLVPGVSLIGVSVALWTARRWAKGHRSEVLEKIKAFSVHK